MPAGKDSSGKTDFKRHNEEVKKAWDAFRAGNPVRVPVVFGISENFLLLNPELNTRGWSYREYCENPDVMMEVQLDLQKWVRWHVLQDSGMGLPADGWNAVYIDLQNTAEAAWLGCRVRYGSGGSVPDTEPLLRQRKEKLYEMEIPDPLHGNIMGRVYEYCGYLSDRIRDYEFEGKPVKGVVPVPHMTDGPFTLACKLRGSTELCTDIYETPDYVKDLMNFVTDAIITRGKAWYQLMGVEYPMQEWRSGFGDDCVELLSVETYREFVLPCHRRIAGAFSKGGPNHIHLCGRSQHLFKTMQEELNMQDFYVGFPTDMGRMRKELGRQVLIMGNMHPMTLRDGSERQIRENVKSILASGVAEGGNFILSGDVAPGTPPESFQTAYETACEHGRLK